MNDRVFLDTNVLVYAYDTHDPVKQKRAQDLLLRGLQREDAVVSTQVLGEFFVAMTRKVRSPISAEDAVALVQLLSSLSVVAIDAPLVHRALQAHLQCRLAYWDSLIVAAAERARCDILLSEDLNPGQAYLGVTVQNPFVD